jgi:hypothetical protein
VPDYARRLYHGNDVAHSAEHVFRAQHRRQLVVGLHAVLQGNNHGLRAHLTANLLCGIGHLPGFGGYEDSIYVPRAGRIAGRMHLRQHDVARWSLHAQAVLAKRVEHRAAGDEDNIVSGLRQPTSEVTSQSADSYESDFHKRVSPLAVMCWQRGCPQIFAGGGTPNGAGKALSKVRP